MLWLATIGAVTALNLTVGPASHHLVILTDLLALSEDAIVGVGLAAFLAVVPFLTLPEAASEGMQALAARFGGRAVLAAAVAVAALAFAGWWQVFQAWPLSGDEFWAAFDTDILRHGRLMAPIPPAWGPYVHALQPTWRLETPDHAFWASTYLPVNAAARAAFALAGSPALAGPAWSALAIGLTWDLARRLWPERRDAAFVAAILLASSAQLIVTAMTPYAMAAHLALNLAWLSLFLRRGALAQAGAIAVAFLATGLHQWIFSPLFAAPFIVQQWIWGSRRTAALHAIAYGLICAFWIAWPGLMFAAHGYPFGAPSHGAAAYALANAFNPFSGGLMAENLLRLTTWQNLITIPLALVGAAWAVRERSSPTQTSERVLPEKAAPAFSERALAAMAAGIALILVFLLLITPFQGHGWGYRYLHGYLGSLALLATGAFVRLTADAPGRRRAWAVFAAASAFSILVCLPLRMLQTRTYAAPAAANWRVLTRDGAEVTIVDVDSIWFGMDLVRNDPFLTTQPRVMRLDALAPAEIAALCAAHSTRLLTGADEAITNLSFQTAAEKTRRTRLLALAGAPPCLPPVAVPPRPRA
jgi:hypothetical protein